MTQQQLIDDLAAETKLSKTAVKAVLKSLPAVLAAHIAQSEGKNATIPGVGVVKLVTRKARVGKNPSTGESIQISEKVVPSIKPSLAFKGLFHEKPQS